jgi:hypothetical protein
LPVPPTFKLPAGTTAMIYEISDPKALKEKSALEA